MVPTVASAQLDPCIADADGNCIGIINPPGGGGGPAVWTGSWYDQYLVLHTVTASSFAACQALLINATAGQDVILGRCQRTQ